MPRHIALRSNEVTRKTGGANWKKVFLNSPLAQTLTPEAIAELLLQLEEIEVQKNQKVVTPQTEGEFFYIIKQGRAHLKFDEFGPQNGECLELNQGNYFGDESLASQVPQSTTVVMQTHGKLLRLEQRKFLYLIKLTLANCIDMPQVLATVRRRSRQIQRMDAELCDNREQPT